MRHSDPRGERRSKPPNGGIPSLTALRCRLRASGFPPLPVNGKAPSPKAWETLTDANDQQIALWERVFPHARSTGILTRDCPAMDIDISIAPAADAVEQLARDRFGEDNRFPVRFGRAPKRAILFQTDAPFPKITANLIAPDGSEHKIEILGNGQQLVAFGIHPGTGRPYSWHGGAPGEFKREDLPRITEQEARAFVADAVELLLTEHGFTVAAARPKEKVNGQDGQTGGKDDWAWLLSNIHDGRNLHDSDRDLAAKLIRSGMSAGAVTNFLRAYFEQSPAPRDARWQERYDDIPRAVATAEEKFGGQKPPDAQPPPPLSFTPYRILNEADIVRRNFLYGSIYIRKCVSGTIGTGAIGKSSLILCENISMAIGRDLLSGTILGAPLRVLYWNGEDDRDELDRRITAIRKHFNIDQKLLLDHLFYDSGHDVPVKIAKVERGNVIVDAVRLAQFDKWIADNQVDVASLDPLINLHGSSETNEMLDAIVKSFAPIAAARNCAIHIAQHTRKAAPGQTEFTVDDARGGSSWVYGLRAARVTNRMTAKEAEDAGIEETERWRYFRITLGKPNYTPPEKAHWVRLASITLANGPADDPQRGDNVGVVEGWTYPDAFAGVTGAHMDWTRNLARTQELRDDPRADAWIGIPLAKHLNLNLSNKADKAKVKNILKKWTDNGVLAVEEREDDRRRKRKFIVPGNWEKPVTGVSDDMD
jgi:hypothetical protein